MGVDLTLPRLRSGWAADELDAAGLLGAFRSRARHARWGRDGAGVLELGAAQPPTYPIDDQTAQQLMQARLDLPEVSELVHETMRQVRITLPGAAAADEDESDAAATARADAVAGAGVWPRALLADLGAIASEYRRALAHAQHASPPWMLPVPLESLREVVHAHVFAAQRVEARVRAASAALRDRAARAGAAAGVTAAAASTPAALPALHVLPVASSTRWRRLMDGCADDERMCPFVPHAFRREPFASAAAERAASERSAAAAAADDAEWEARAQRVLRWWSTAQAVLAQDAGSDREREQPARPQRKAKR